MLRTAPLTLLLALVVIAPVSAQTRDEKVRNDRQRVEADDSWIYTDLSLAKRLAKFERKPLLVVFRCIPCEACALLDEQVVAREPAVRAIMDQFICVRIPKGNAMDLTQFQFDYDLSFQAFFMNADGTIYGRYGTRSSREHADSDVSLEGFAAAMEGALQLHKAYPGIANVLRGKQPKPVEFKQPEDYPSLSGKYKPELDFVGATAKSCLHCHQIRNAEHDLTREKDLPWTDQVLYPYPTPGTIGLQLDPKTRSMVKAVEPDSPAAKAGLKPGDSVLTLAGQVIVSPADIQWVLHHAEESAALDLLIHRDGQSEALRLNLPSGWREKSDLSWRVTSWNLRRMAFGGMFLESLSGEELRKLNLPADQLALRAKHVGQYGPHAFAKRAGLKKGDVIVAFNGLTSPLTETELLANTLKSTKPNQQVAVTYVRNGKRHETKIRMQ